MCLNKTVKWRIRSFEWRLLNEERSYEYYRKNDCWLQYRTYCWIFIVLVTFLSSICALKKLKDYSFHGFNPSIEAGGCNLSGIFQNQPRRGGNKPLLPSATEGLRYVSRINFNVNPRLSASNYNVIDLRTAQLSDTFAFCWYWKLIFNHLPIFINNFKEN